MSLGESNKTLSSSPYFKSLPAIFMKCENIHSHLFRFWKLKYRIQLSTNKTKSTWKQQCKSKSRENRGKREVPRCKVKSECDGVGVVQAEGTLYRFVAHLVDFFCLSCSLWLDVFYDNLKVVSIRRRSWVLWFAHQKHENKKDGCIWFCKHKRRWKESQLCGAYCRWMLICSVMFEFWLWLEVCWWHCKFLLA